jgi:hypothetical protein
MTLRFKFQLRSNVKGAYLCSALKCIHDLQCTEDGFEGLVWL